jgi:CBS domain-containing protein
VTVNPAAAAAAEVGRICSRNVVAIEADEDLTRAAHLMRTGHVGFLVVQEVRGEKRRVVGVLTDRDIVVAVVAREIDPRTLRVSDVMTRNPVMVSESCTVDVALSFMREAAVRRMPIVRGDSELVGVLSLDDVVDRIAQQLSAVACAYRSELRVERSARP